MLFIHFAQKNKGIVPTALSFYINVCNWLSLLLMICLL